MIIFDTPVRKGSLILGLIVMAVFPFFASSFFVDLVNRLALASLACLALNLLTGCAGQLSLGHAGFLMIGAFITGIANVHLGLPIWIIIPIVALGGIITGFVVGLPALRLKGVYLALSTMAAYYIIYEACARYQYVVGAGWGIELQDPTIGPIVLNDDRVWYFTLCTIVVLVTAYILNLLKTKPGRAWIAIRDRDVAAQLMGINIGYYKVLAFVVSGAITAITGSLYAYYTNVVHVEEYNFMMNIDYLAMIIIGGMGSVPGSFMGAALVVLLPYGLMYLFDSLAVSSMIEQYFFAVKSGFFGLLIVVFLLVEPSGLIEIWRRIRDYFALWPFRYKSVIVTKR
jgi:branched-chain amino acid transport system permease protein